jgi:hypothetical protein
MEPSDYSEISVEISGHAYRLGIRLSRLSNRTFPQGMSLYLISDLDHWLRYIETFQVLN